MKEKLFKNTNFLGNKSFRVGDKFTNSQVLYIIGYFKAANKLIEIIINNNTNKSIKNSLFYPICFNYRHYIELHLKSLIVDISKYEKTYSEKIEKELTKTHSLEKLLNNFKKYFNRLSTEPIPANIERIIIEMHNLDTNGEQFRYYESKNKKVHFTEEENYDIQNIQTKMKEVYELLWAIDGMINQYQ